MVDKCDVVEPGSFVVLAVFATPLVFVVDFVLVEEVPVAGGLVVVCVCANADAQRTPKLPASTSAPAVQ